MTENQLNRYSQRKFSAEEKRAYDIAWKNSGLSLADFCKSQGISRSALYKWSNQFEKENSQSDFSPLSLPTKPSAINMTQLTIHSCDSNNSMELKISIPEHRLVSFIKEMCNATSVIR
jgi:transposase-like protein